MASWEDGPEYAPYERPARFDSPAVPALAAEPPAVDAPASAPVEHPAFVAPVAPVAALATLRPGDPLPSRDPREPYEVVSATLTPDPLGTPAQASGPGAWGAAHWSPPATPVPSPPGPWGPPTGHPWAPPTAPLAGPAGAPVPGAFPAPGTPQWFGPGPSQPSPTASVVDARAVIAATTPALLLTLALGVIYVLAPLTLCTAYFLTSRVRAGGVAVRRAFLVALGVLGLAALGAWLTNLYGVGEWWVTVSRWALVLSLILLVVVPLIVWAELRQRREQARRWP